MKNVDQAGKEYWNETWNNASLPKLWNVNSKRLKYTVENSLFLYITDALAKHQLINKDKSLVEVGCARSAVLPLFAKRFGFQVSGIDYSPNGCEQARQILERENIQGKIYCSDIFSIPDNLLEKFDVVISFGLVEHFSDTEEIVNALSSLIKPGGIILTNIPNMRGTIGFLQKLFDRQIYEIHVPLSADDVRFAHEQAGLDIKTCDYFLSTNFGILNLNSVSGHNIEWWVKKIMLSMLTRVSMGVWWLESLVGRFPASRFFSPYVNCIATKRMISKTRQ